MAEKSVQKRPKSIANMENKREYLFRKKSK